MKTLVLIIISFMINYVTVVSQTMQVQAKSGNKTYNISDVQSITFSKVPEISSLMVLIPAGTFQMGQQDSVGTPIHTVNITKPFYMSKYEVTQKLYTYIEGTNPSAFPGNDDNPVESVSWLDAVQFCNDLSTKEGLELCYTFGTDSNWACDFSKKGYRLPTEAEWEYSCRAGTTTDFYLATNDTLCDSIAWYANNSNSTTHPVGQKTPNNFGMYDMSGNVWELCWDWYASYNAGPESDPTGPTSGTDHVLRGGSWAKDANSCRSGTRFYDLPTDRYNGRGFRLVRTK